jgi:hypothetical protein
MLKRDLSIEERITAMIETELKEALESHDQVLRRTADTS